MRRNITQRIHDSQEKLSSKNIVEKPLDDPSKILVSPLHMKLGLMKPVVSNLVRRFEKQGRLMNLKLHF